jgi:hypothetical protein
MQNTLPESIKKKIEDEAEKLYPYEVIVGKPNTDRFTHNQIADIGRQCYTAAAEAILSDPRDYDLINREGAVLLFSHYTRYRSEPDSKMSFEEWLGSNPAETLPSESATPSDRVQQLEHAYDQYIQLLNDELNEIVGYAERRGWESKRVQKGLELREKINALKTI